MANSFEQKFPEFAQALKQAGVSPTVNAATQPKRNFFTAGVSSGIDQLQGTGGAALAAVGKLTGVSPLEKLGTDIYQRNVQEAAQNGRPDLEGVPTSLTGLGYQVAKQIPNLAAIMLTSRLPGFRSVGNMLPKSALAAGAYVPEALGGGGAALDAAASFAQRKAGIEFAKRVASNAAASYPISVGSLYQEAIDRGDPNAGDAVKALALGVPYAALEGVEPRQLEAFAKGGIGSGIGQRLMKGVIAGAAQEAPVEAAQTALEQSFRPDISMKDKLSNIVQAAITGGAVGGVFGGVANSIGGVRQLKTAPTGEVQTDALKNAIDGDLGLNVNPQAAQQQLPGIPQPPPESQVFDAQTQGVRPLANATDEELQQGLAAIQQRALTDSQRQSTAEGLASQDNMPVGQVERIADPNDMLMAQQIRAELDRRQAAAAPLQEQTGFDLFERANAPLSEQRAPTYAPTETAPSSTPSAADAFAAELVGGNKRAKWAQSVLNHGGVDEVDVTRRVIDAVNSYDEVGKPLPVGLMTAAQKIGLLDANGQARDLGLELDAVQRKNNELWQRAKETGQGQAEAVAYQTKNLKPLIALQERLSQAQQRTAPEPQVTTLDNTSVAPTGPAPSTAIESMATFADPRNAMRYNVEVSNSDANTPEKLAKLQARAEAQPGGKAVGGSMTAYTKQVVNVPLSLIQNLPSAGKQTLVGEQSPKYQRLMKLVQRNGWNPKDPIKVVVNHRGEAFIENGNARVDVAAAIGQSEVPVEVSWMNGGEQANSPWSPQQLTARLASGNTATKAGPTPTNVPEQSLRGQFVDQAVLGKLDRISRDASVPEDLRNEAVNVLAANQSSQPNARDQADELLADYALRTGDIAFSNRNEAVTQPPMSDTEFTKNFAQLTGQLPQNIRDAINVVPTVNDLPAVIQRAASKYGLSMDGVEGVVYGDQVYIVRNKVTSPARLQELVNHEVFGHGGARALLGDQRQAFFSKAFQLAGGLEGLRSIARTFGVESELNQYVPGNRDLTSEDQVALVDELLAQIAGTATGKFKLAVMSFVSKMKAGLVQLLRAAGLNTVADRLDTLGASDFARMVTEMRQAVLDGRSINGSDTAFKMSTPQGMARSAQNLMSSVANIERLVQSQPVQEGATTLNKLHLYTSSLGHIVEYFGKLFDMNGGINGLRQMLDANYARGNTEQRLAHLSKKVYAAYEAVLQSSKESADAISTLMSMTYFQIDPRKSWDQHTWLQGTPNAANLQRRVAEANAVYRKMVQTKSPALAVYNDMIHLNEAFYYAQQAQSLYNLLNIDGTVSQEFKDSIQNPMDVYLNDQQTYDSAKASRDFWSRQTADLVTKTSDYIKNQRGLAAQADAATQKKIADSSSILKARLRSIAEQQEGMDRAPYFHIGRFGNFVVKFNIRAGEQKLADPKAMDRIAEAFDKAGINGIEFPKDGTRANAFIRFENQVEQDIAWKVVKQLEAEGVLDSPESFDDRNEKLLNSVNLEQTPLWAQRLMDSVKSTYFGEELVNDENKKLLDALNEQFNKHLQQHFLNLLPETSINRVMTQRNYVPGFSSDMVRAYFFRTQVGGRALANLYASAKMAEANKNIYSVVKDARSGDPKMSRLKQAVAVEIFKREANRPAMVSNKYIDTWRAFNHAYFLGMSPSYFMVNISQIGVLLWPELAKKHGFVNAAKAIAKVTPDVIRILSATLSEAKKVGWNNLPDASITSDVLLKANIKGPKADFITRIVNSGIIDIGSQSRELGRVVEGRQDSKMDQALRWAGAMGYYSEMTSRLVAALAARELHGGKSENGDMFKYATETVRQSMLSYETWNQARATGRMGLAGEFTPVMTSFMQYTFQLTEKLYREFHAAFVDSARTSQERAEARNFLIGHMAAITALTGTLGMPMAAVFAAVFDKLVNAFGDDNDEPMNVTAAIENWLADTFGKGAGEVIARGVPRALGIDLNQRAGEQNLIPYLHSFSKLLTDRRDWKEASKDWALNTLGSPVSMISSIVQGGDKVAQGDYLEGMRMMVPAAIKGPVEAFKLSQDGYTDGKGNKLPMSAGALDIMWQALGFNPAEKAAYNTAKGVQASLRGDLTQRATTLRNNIAKAYEAGDQAALRDAVVAAADFSRKNPAYDVIKGIEGVLTSRAKERAQASSANAPLGTKKGYEDRTRFADLNN